MVVEGEGSLGEQDFGVSAGALKPEGMPDNLEDAHKLIAEQQATIKRLEAEVRLDELTGLLKGVPFIRRITELMGHTGEDKRMELGGVIAFVDLNKMGELNRKIGHQNVDKVLQIIAQRLKLCTKRENDAVARLGGDELGVLLYGTDPQSAAFSFFKRFAQSLRDDPIVLEIDDQRTEIPVAFSVGIAPIPRQIADLTAGADEDAYHKIAKKTLGDADRLMLLGKGSKDHDKNILVYSSGTEDVILPMDDLLDNK